ncbi:MotA/TolQ/ExbB proton channel family protein [Candidatus Dependentiae bacterium]|nr:MAG: MotA/TolQ/ExbB proton channel family protein [Candidatus Dependentiae bacterium]
MVSFTGNALWHLVQQSDSISKGVLLLLLILSIACWSLFLGKIMIMRTHIKQLQKTISNLPVESSLTQLFEKITLPNESIAFYFLSDICNFVHLFFKKRDAQKSFEQHEIDLIMNYAQQTVDAFVEKERKGLAFLSTAAGVSPLLGLFGTVWGLVHAFIRISQQQSADIATVAPGIAEALITTLAGLMVAIPALVMFNYIQVQARTIECLLEQLADRIEIIVTCCMFTRKLDAQIQTTPTVTHDNGSITHATR